MALTRVFRETVVARATCDRRSRQAMLTEVINELLSGDAKADKFLLSEYINATLPFGCRATVLNKPNKVCKACSTRAATPAPKTS